MNATAKLFMNGRSQAVRLPAEFRFEGTEVHIHRDPLTGNVVLSPKPNAKQGWDEFFRLRALVDPEDLKDFMVDREQGVQERNDLFDDD